MNLRELQQHPHKFRSALRIDCDGQPKRLSEVCDLWQDEDFQALDPAWRLVAGQPRNGVPCKMRGWLERPRGHSKTQDVIVQVVWALFASKRQISGVVCAVDRDQAKLCRDAADRLVRMNPWLGQILQVDQWKVTNTRTGSTLDILSADVASSYGLLIDFAVCDEISHWSKPDLFHSILSAVAKKQNCLLLCIGNAGFRDSWQWTVRELVRKDDDWYFSRLDGPQASWITLPRLDEQRRLLPRIAFERLWMNCWTSGSGDALEPGDIDAAITLKGSQRPKLGWNYVAGLDLGLKRDASALVVVGRHVGYHEQHEKPKKIPPQTMTMIDLGIVDAPQIEWDTHFEEGTDRLQVARVDVWKPRNGGKVSIDAIFQTIRDLDKIYRFSCVSVDPWNAAYLVELLAKEGIAIESTPFTPSNLQTMATAVLEAFSNRNIDLFHRELVADLRALRVEERSYGIRLVPGKTESGTRHGDAATALALALLAAKSVRIGYPKVPDSLIIY